MKFPSSKMFREVMREENVLKGKDIKFKKNDSDNAIVVCRDALKYEYRVYGRWMKGEMTF